VTGDSPAPPQGLTQKFGRIIFLLYITEGGEAVTQPSQRELELLEKYEVLDPDNDDDRDLQIIIEAELYLLATWFTEEWEKSGESEGPAHDPERPSTGAPSVLHSDAGRGPTEPGAARFLPALGRRRQGQEARAHRHHAQAPGHPQRPASGPPAMARTTISLTVQDSR
jgi:hypothetical protein